MRSRRCAREAALQALYQCDTLGDWSPDTVDLFFAHFKGVGRDPGAEARETVDDGHEEESLATEGGEASLQYDANIQFAQKLAHGVLLHFDALDGAIAAASTHWSLARMARVDRNILRVAAFEITHLEDIPLSVSINEAIEVAKRFGGPESPTFINGVLDNIAHSFGGKKLQEMKKRSAG